jgi:hypothetical protein
MSEQRVHDLLEGMCTAMAAKNTLYKRMNDSGSGARMWRRSPLNGTWMEPPRQEKDGARCGLPSPLHP